MKRKLWIDYSRGICAFCVLLAHQTTNESISFLYNGFFLMLFFFISGYLHHDRTIKESLVNISKSLIIPYAGLSIFGLFLYTGNIKSLLAGDIVFIQTFLTRLIMGRTLWFVSCLVCVKILFIVLQSILDRCRKWNAETIGIISVLSILYVFIVSQHPAECPPFWYWTTAVYSLGFYILGYFCKKLKVEDRLPKIKWYYGVLLICAYSTLSYIIQTLYDIEYHVYTDSFESPLTFIILAVSGILCVLIFSFSVSDFNGIANKFIIALGQNSLLLFAINSKIRLTLEKIVEFLHFSNLPEVVFVFLICIMQGAIVLLVGSLVNKYIPWLVGKHK